MALYGKRNAVDVENIDILRADLIQLNDRTIRDAIQVTNKDKESPPIEINELYTGHSKVAEPPNVVWIRRPLHAPVAANTCFEVTHCNKREEVHDVPWLYVARGSGRWVCHNKTMQLDKEYSQAWGTPTRSSAAKPKKKLHCGAGFPHCNFGHPSEGKGRSALKSRKVSSIQWVGHPESYNDVPHHEIVFQQLPKIRCGLPGDFRKCNDRENHGLEHCSGEVKHKPD